MPSGISQFISGFIISINNCDSIAIWYSNLYWTIDIIVDNIDWGICNFCYSSNTRVDCYYYIPDYRTDGSNIIFSYIISALLVPIMLYGGMCCDRERIGCGIKKLNFFLFE